MRTQILDNQLREKIRRLETGFSSLPEARKAVLDGLADSIATLSAAEERGVLFVCTHNSRRSTLAQVWFLAAAEHYGLTGYGSYSGGTEITAFNPRMVQALREYGFRLPEPVEESGNPVYELAAKEGRVSLFSKVFNDVANPSSNFVAVMVCTDAEKNCPFVPGAEARISLPFIDPKRADDSPEEAQVYLDKVSEIGQQILYVASCLTR